MKVTREVYVASEAFVSDDHKWDAKPRGLGAVSGERSWTIREMEARTRGNRRDVRAVISPVRRERDRAIMREILEGSYEGKIGVRDDDGVVADGCEVRDASVDRAGKTESGRPEHERSLRDSPVRDLPVVAGHELVKVPRGSEHDRC